MGWLISAIWLGAALFIVRGIHVCARENEAFWSAIDALETPEFPLGGDISPAHRHAADTCGEAGHSEGLPASFIIRARSFHGAD